MAYIQGKVLPDFSLEEYQCVQFGNDFGQERDEGWVGGKDGAGGGIAALIGLRF